MLSHVQKIFSFKQFCQALATMLLGLIAFVFAMQAWMETGDHPEQEESKPSVDVILIQSGEAKIVKAKLRTLASLVAKIDCA